MKKELRTLHKEIVDQTVYFVFYAWQYLFQFHCISKDPKIVKSAPSIFFRQQWVHRVAPIGPQYCAVKGFTPYALAFASAQLHIAVDALSVKINGMSRIASDKWAARVEDDLEDAFFWCDLSRMFEITRPLTKPRSNVRVHMERPDGTLSTS